MVRAATAAVALVTAIVLALPSEAAKSPRKLPHKATVGTSGGSVARQLICGASRRLRLVRVWQRVGISVRVANRHRRPRAAAARRASLRLERCVKGRWQRTKGLTLGRAPARRGAVRRFRAGLALSQPGDLRVRAFVPGDRRRRRALSRAAYVRALATDVAEVPVSFRVVNRNGSRLSCMADGKTYDVRGRLVGSRAAIDRGGAVTVYLHQIGLASDYWHFTSVPGYDFAGELARRGHV